MRKLYTTLCALFVSASTCLFAAPVVNTTTSVEYDDLASAIEAAATGETFSYLHGKHLQGFANVQAPAFQTAAHTVKSC